MFRAPQHPQLWGADIAMGCKGAGGKNDINAFAKKTDTL